jgi:hypothetical protein
MTPAMLLAAVGGALLGRFTTTTLVLVGALVVTWFLYKEFIWSKVKGG